MAFNPPKLMDEGLGSTEAVLFSTAWTGNLPSAASFALGWRVTLLFFIQHLALWPVGQNKFHQLSGNTHSLGWEESPSLGHGDAFAKHVASNWLSIAMLVSAQTGSLPCREELPSPRWSF